MATWRMNLIGLYRMGMINGGLTMDIKTRIDGLTEAEAKAALVEILCDISYYRPCFIQHNDECPHYISCLGEKKCAKVWLEEALKEARK